MIVLQNQLVLVFVGTVLFHLFHLSIDNTLAARRDILLLPDEST